MKRFLPFIASACIPCAAQNLLQNPSFESGLTGWNATGSVAARADAGAQFDAGNYSVFNREDQPASGIVWQAVATAPGETYRISFHIAGQFAGAGSIRIDVFDGTGGGGTLLQSATFSTSSGGVAYEQVQASFVATSGTSTVVFTDVSTQTTSTDLYLDGVELVQTGAQQLTVEYLFTAAVSFDTAPGTTYSILYSESLEPGSWVVVGTVVGDGTRMTFYHPATSERQFYEVKPK